GMYPHASGEEIPYQDVFLDKAMEAGFNPVPLLTVMGSRAEESSGFYLSPTLRVVVRLSSPDQLELLTEGLLQRDMPISTLLESAQALCGRGVQSAVSRILDVIQQYSEDPSTVDKAATLAAVLIEFVDMGI